MESLEENEEVWQYSIINSKHLTLIFINRWLSEQGIKIASEKKMRLLSKEIISVEILADIAPFTRSLKGGGEEVKASAIVWISCLSDKITELLDQYARCELIGLFYYV